MPRGIIMKKLLFIGLLTIGQASFAAVLHVKNSNSLGVPTTATIYWKNGFKSMTIPVDGRFHPMNSGFNNITPISWLMEDEKGGHKMKYRIPLVIGTASLLDKIEFGRFGGYRYNGEDKIRQAGSNKEEDWNIGSAEYL